MNQDSRIQLANKISFAVLGSLEASWAPMVPFVKTGMSLNDAQYGRMLFAMGLGSILALPIVGSLINRFGCRLVSVLGALTIGASLVGISLVDSLIYVTIMLAIFGAALIFVDVASNVNAVIVETILKKPLMSGFHAGYSLGTIMGAMLMTLLLNMFTKLGIDLAHTLIYSTLAVFCIFVGLSILGSKDLIKDVKPFNSQRTQNQETNISSRKFTCPPVVFIIGCLCFIMYGTEGALLSWTTVLATENRGISPVLAGYFYLFFAFTMTFSRVMGNRIVRTFGRRKTVVAGALMVGTGFFITALTHDYFGLMLGFSLIGLGAGNIVPQLVSFAGSVKNIKVQSAISIVNALGYSGILLGPVIIGEISHHSSLEISFMTLGGGVFLVAFISYLLIKTRS